MKSANALVNNGPNKKCPSSILGTFSYTMKKWAFSFRGISPGVTRFFSLDVLKEQEPALPNRARTSTDLDKIFCDDIPFGATSQ